MSAVKVAAYWEPHGEGTVRCLLCPHHCRLAPGKRGICLTRQNLDGKLVSLNYCRPVSMAVDPIEKKPLYHFHPGASIFSTGPNGCTLKCAFCQNCEISQEILPARFVPAADLVRATVDSGSLGVAYTYSEPYIWYETIMEVGAGVRKAGLKNVMVTNGYMEPAPLADLLGIVDAMNIDIKSMSPAFYRKLCKAELEPVLRTCEQVKKAGCHLEITNLLITGENDAEDETRSLAAWIAGHLGRNTPLHVSRYFPRHRMQNPATPGQTLLRACRIAAEHLDYVYLGNAGGAEFSDTRCPSCKAVLIRRAGYDTRVTDTLAHDSASGRTSCAACKTEIPVRM